MFSRATRALTLDRRPFTEAFFDSDAPADAAILVSFVAAATYLGLLLRGVYGSFGLPELLQVVLSGVISWLIMGFATWFVATRMFKSSGRPQTMIALQGLAVLPLLLWIFPDLFSGLVWAVGFIWYVAILVVATREASELKTRDAAVAVLIGAALVILIQTLLRVPFALIGGVF